MSGEFEGNYSETAGKSSSLEHKLYQVYHVYPNQPPKQKTKDLSAYEDSSSTNIGNTSEQPKTTTNQEIPNEFKLPSSRCQNHIQAVILPKRQSELESATPSRHLAIDFATSSRHLASDSATSSSPLEFESATPSRHLASDTTTPLPHLAIYSASLSRHLATKSTTPSLHLATDSITPSIHLATDSTTALGHLSIDSTITSGHLATDSTTPSIHLAIDSTTALGHLSIDSTIPSRHLATDSTTPSGHQATDSTTPSRHLVTESTSPSNPVGVKSITPSCYLEMGSESPYFHSPQQYLPQQYHQNIQRSQNQQMNVSLEVVEAQSTNYEQHQPNVQTSQDFDDLTWIEEVSFPDLLQSFHMDDSYPATTPKYDKDSLIAQDVSSMSLSDTLTTEVEITLPKRKEPVESDSTPNDTCDNPRSDKLHNVKEIRSVRSIPHKKQNMQEVRSIPHKIQNMQEIRSIPLWLVSLLHNPDYNPSVITWIDVTEGEFRIRNPDRLAKARGKNGISSTKVSYQSILRGMRHHYKTEKLTFVRTRMTYRFGPKMKNWKPRNLDDPNFYKFHRNHQKESNG